MTNVPKPESKSALIPLGLIAAASATDAAIHKKMFGSGNMTLIISNEEMNDNIKIIKSSLEESGLLIKYVSETVENKTKEQTGGFFKMLLSTLSASLLGNLLKASLLGNLLTGKGTISKSASSFNKFYSTKLSKGT